MVDVVNKNTNKYANSYTNSYAKPKIVSWEKSKQIKHDMDSKTLEQNNLKREQANFAMLMKELEYSGQVRFV